MMENHECAKEESFKEMAGEFRELAKKTEAMSVDIALVKRDVTDLKTVTVTMSDCIRALTETSIKGNENNITRGQFYVKIDEMVKAREVAFEKVDGRIDSVVSRIDKIDGQLDLVKKSVGDLGDDIDGWKKWLGGIGAALVLLALADLYRIIVLHGALL